MSRAATYSNAATLPSQPDPPKPEEIRAQLQKILTSPAFHGSKRCYQFLGYVCEKSLSGEAGSLKERTIAVEVFGRQPQSDLGDDTIVRVGAREVRKRLAQYYVTPEGAASQIHIDLPSGSYAPEFRYMGGLKQEPNPEKEVSALVVALVPPRQWRRHWLLGVVASGVGFVLFCALLLFIAGKWPGSNANAKAFRLFWNPVFQAREPLLLAVGHPVVYHPSARALRLSEQRLPAPAMPMQRAIQLPPNELDGSDLVPVFNQYVGFGDMVAAIEVAAMLGRQSKAVRVRLASGIEFADLRQAQALLIGSITNRWTIELGQAWRFQFSRTPDFKTVIVDTMIGAGAKPPENRRQWSIPSKEDGSAPEDYILVSRIRNSVTGGLLFVAAGLKQFGTEAGGRLLTAPDELGLILRKLPEAWETKNLQVVLHVKVIGNTPSQPELVAWHVW